MTIEQVELRRILKQMLADEGINRETLKEMVREIIDEKIEKAIKQCLEETNMSAQINHFVQSGLGETAKKVVAQKVNAWFHEINVTIELPHGSIIQ